jgi:hypothetical protein
MAMHPIAATSFFLDSTAPFLSPRFRTDVNVLTMSDELVAVGAPTVSTPAAAVNADTGTRIRFFDCR